MNQNLPGVQLRLTGAQVNILITGLESVRGAYLRWQFAPAFNGISLGQRRKDLPDCDAMQKLLAARQMLSWRTGRSRIVADQYDLAAWIFAARVVRTLWRRRDERVVVPGARRPMVQRLLCKLERHRKRAKRAARANGCVTHEVFPHWGATLAWIRRRLLVVPKPGLRRKTPLLPRRYYRLLLDEAGKTATAAITEGGYVLPNQRELRQALRRVLRSGRRSLQPGTPTLLKDKAVLLNRILKFLRLRRRPVVPYPWGRPAEQRGRSPRPPVPDIRSTGASPERPARVRVPSKKERRHRFLPAAEIDDLKRAYQELPLTVRSVRIADLVSQGISRRELARHLGVSEGTVRRDLKIAALAPQVRAAVERGASAKRLLEVERQKAFEACSTARIELERDTGRPSSELSRLLIELLEREAQWEAG